MENVITLFLCGDVMTGRGIDQIMPHPSDPILYEPYMKSAVGYVQIAEAATGPIPRPVDFSYIWGDALTELEQRKPDLRIINLETSITKSGDYWRGKGINYRMNPENIPCLTAAGIDCCTLANNHTLDWGYGGLAETIETLRKADIRTAGAGMNLGKAEAPAVMDVDKKGRVLVFSFGTESSGIPQEWAASRNTPGVHFLPDLSAGTAHRIRDRVLSLKQKGDIVVASIHWGGNWGYEVARSERTFARMLIDEASVDVIHGHSSHHVKGIEVYRDRLILYGCGDFLNDYEGIRGHGHYRGDIGLMYFAGIDSPEGRIRDLTMVPTRIRHLRVNRAGKAEGTWLTDVLNREGVGLETSVVLNDDDTLSLSWG